MDSNYKCKSHESQELDYCILRIFLEHFENQISKNFDPKLSAKIDFLISELEKISEKDEM